MMKSQRNTRESDSPVILVGISGNYLRAFDCLWSVEFEGKNDFHWDASLVFHPACHLLGISMEAALKGLLVCRGQKPPKQHDLENLLSLLNDDQIEGAFANALVDLAVPQGLLDCNPDTSKSDMEAIYHRHNFHLDLLNRLYDYPYATRYPVLGAHSTPDIIALRRIAGLTMDALDQESRSWTPSP